MNNKERLIEIANRYYNGLPNQISDKEYDELEAEVQKEFPGFNVKEHITYNDDVTVGRHLYPFVALNKVKYNQGTNLAPLVKSPTAVLVPKYDGSSIRAYYSDGKLTNIFSRSNEVTGVNQTKKLRNKVITEVPSWVKFIDYELLVPMEVFGDNARSKANGLVNSKYLEDDVEKYAFPCPFYCNEYDGRSYRSRMEEICGDRFGDHKLPFEFDRSALENFSIDRVKIGDNTYAIDGIVVYDDFDNLPVYVNRIFKFYYLESKETEIDHLEWNRSDFGFYIPKIILKPVEISGKWIGKVAGGSVDTVIGQKLCKGAKVKVILAGLTIPQIAGVVSRPAEEDYCICNCWTCHGPLTYTSTGYVCENPECDFWNAGVLAGFALSLYPPSVVQVIKMGGFASVDAFFNKISSSETLLNTTKELIEEKLKTPDSMKNLIVNCLNISRLSVGVRARVVKLIKLSEKGIEDGLKFGLTPRQYSEVKRKIPALIRFLNRVDSLMKEKFNLQILER